MRVVIAEDDPIQRGILEQQLRAAGYEVEGYGDGDAAWAALQHEPSRLVVTDSLMPAMNGSELIRRIRTASWPQYTYTLLVRSPDTKEDAADSLAAGADDYLTKPVDPRELRARMAIGERILDLEDRLQASTKRVRRLASQDELTDLLNRQAIHAHADAELDRGAREKKSVSVALLDVDRFKVINDTYGHRVGDDVLRAIAETLATNKRPYDWVGRWSGQEFLVVLPGTTPEQAKMVADRMRQAVSQIAVAPDEADPIQVTASVGVSTQQPGSRGNLVGLLVDADKALYRAKKEGRNRVCVAEGATQPVARQSA